jgi:hypothetical protein
MNVLKNLRTHLLACASIVMLLPIPGGAQQGPGSRAAGTQRTPAERDGQRDFDFHIGTWKTHVSRLPHPLTGSTAWLGSELDRDRHASEE